VLVVGLAGCNRTPERSTDAFCAQVASVQGLDQVLAGTDAARTAEQVEQLRRLQEVAPGDIEPSVARLVAITDELAHAVGSTPDAARAATDVFARHQGDLTAITDAGTAVERYALERCGVRLNPTGTTLPGAGTTTTSAPGTTGR